MSEGFRTRFLFYRESAARFLAQKKNPALARTGFYFLTENFVFLSASPRIGKFIFTPWVSSMSAIHLLWESTGSTLTPMALMWRLSNSGFSLETAPSSVVQTGVKSLGCEKRMTQSFPAHS